jgi:hypothetical protein
MDWNEISITFACTLPFLSLAFLVMGLTRYFRHEMTRESKRLVRRSFATYGLHWIAVVIPYFTRPKTDFVAGDIFLWVTLLIQLLLLIASVYFGVRSHVAAGRRAALASASMIAVYLVYGEIFYLHLVGKVSV